MNCFEIFSITLISLLILVSSVEPAKDRQGGETKKSKRDQNGDNLIWELKAPVDPVKVGYIREVELVPEFKHHMKTLSMDPPIFEIPGFLTHRECDRLVKEAKDEGLEKSPLMDDPDVINSKTTFDTFDEWDTDSDGFVSATELMNLPGKRDLYFTVEDIHEMFKELNMDTDGNGKIDFKEFKEVTVRKIKKYFNFVRRKIPRLRSRNSNQAWIWHDNPHNVIIKNLHQRLNKLTGLPIQMIRSSEPLQVVRYLPKGHYHCHHDSDEYEEGKPCCVYGNTEDCRLCRYITVLYFLNNPLEGGETAFPLADNATFEEEAWIEQAPRLCNLAKHCHDANVYVKPEKGKAVMWYNHIRDPANNWIGEMINLSYHGGCDVIRGVKWVANNWLNVIGWPGSKIAKDGWKNVSPKRMLAENKRRIKEEDKRMEKLYKPKGKDGKDDNEDEKSMEQDEEDKLPGEADDNTEQGEDSDDSLLSDHTVDLESLDNDKDENALDMNELNDQGSDDMTEIQGEDDSSFDQGEVNSDDVNDESEGLNDLHEGLNELGADTEKQGEEDETVEQGEMNSEDMNDETATIGETESLNELGDDYEELDDSFEHDGGEDVEETTLRRARDEL